MYKVAAVPLSRIENSADLMAHASKLQHGMLQGLAATAGTSFPQADPMLVAEVLEKAKTVPPAKITSFILSKLPVSPGTELALHLFDEGLLRPLAIKGVTEKEIASIARRQGNLIERPRATYSPEKKFLLRTPVHYPAEERNVLPLGKDYVTNLNPKVKALAEGMAPQRVQVLKNPPKRFKRTPPIASGSPTVAKSPAIEVPRQAINEAAGKLKGWHVGAGLAGLGVLATLAMLAKNKREQKQLSSIEEEMKKTASKGLRYPRVAKVA